MKKIILISVVLLMAVYGQTANNKINIGIIGGINVNSAEVEILEEGADVSSNTVIGIGGVLDLRFNQNLGLRFEPMYLQKGIGKTELNIQPGIDWYSSSSYLEIPVLIKAEFGERVKPYLLIGPSIGILLDSEVKAKLNNLTFKGDSKSVTENIDLSLSFGGGFIYPLNNLSIFIEGRYLLGLSNNIKGGTFEISTKNVAEEIEWSKDTDTLLNRGFLLMLGITIPI
jgi:hypothetical protein